MLFEWSERKAADNLRKHAIAFHSAQQVFNDPNAVSRPDLFLSEERWQIIGQAPGTALLLVVFSLRYDGETEIIRMISARVAEPREVRRYVGQDHSF